MSFEDRLRSGLREAAGSAEATRAKWESVRERSMKGRRARIGQRLAVAGLSLAAVLALIAGLWLMTDRDERTGPVTKEPTKPVEESRGPYESPPYVLTVTGTGDLQIRTTPTAHTPAQILSTVGTVDVRAGFPRMSTTPDGRFLFVDRVQDEGPCAGETRVIDRFDLVRKQTERGFAEGADPAVSPDGASLAYVTHSDGNCTTYDTLIAAPLQGGKSRRWTIDGEVRRPAWSPDGRSVAVARPVGDAEEIFVIDSEDDTALIADGQNLELPATFRFGAFTHLGEVFAVGVPQDGLTFIEIGDPGGEPLETGSIPGVAELVSASTSPDGQNALVLRQVPGQPASAAEPEDRVLNGFAFGHERPSHYEIATGDIIAAAWLTRAPPGVEAPKIPPATVVGATADGQIVEVDTLTGEVERIADRGAWPGVTDDEIALSPDGRDVYFERVRPTPGEGCEGSDYSQPEVVQVSRNGGDLQVVVSGARWPAISADGDQLAYVKFNACEQGGTVQIRELSSGRVMVLGEAFANAAGPLSFDPAGRLGFSRPFEDGLWTSLWFDPAADGIEERFVAGRFRFARDSGRAVSVLAEPTGARVARWERSRWPDRTEQHPGTRLDLGGRRLVGWTVDSSGHHVLLRLADAESAEARYLYRWTFGTLHPVQIGTDDMRFTAVTW